MTLSIHNIKPSANSTKKRKVIGRGNASGHGTYSGHGLKGQKARAGVSNLKRLGMKQVLLRTPKKRGFISLKPDNQVVNLSAINNLYKDGDVITAKDLYEKGLIPSLSPKKNVKILGKGDLKISNLKLKGLLISASAKEQILKMKGKISE
jgi:large subunit ribosomal protein L15